MKVPNLIYSTTILFLSNFIVRIIGFLYKIFLSKQIGANGLGVFHMIFHFLMLCVCITTTGIPVALNSLISKEKKMNNKHNINSLFISTLYLSFFISILISLIVFFNSKFIGFKLIHSNDSQMLIICILPAISLITVSSILRNYYYGIKKVQIPAIGQILEQLSRVAFVVILFSFIKNKSIYPLVALLGISIGEIVNILFIIINLFFEPTLSNTYAITLNDFKNSINNITKMALPITFNRVFAVVIQSISSILIPSRLELSGLSHLQSMSLYGTITGMVFPFLFLPFTLTSALVVNLIPSISQEMPNKNYTLINKKIFFSIFLTSCIGFSSSLVYFFFGEKICMLIFNSQLAGTYLKAISISTFFMVLNHTLSGILHSIEKEYNATINNIIGLLVQLFCIYFLLPISSINVYGFIYGFTLSGVIIFTLHVITLYKTQRRWH